MFVLVYRNKQWITHKYVQSCTYNMYMYVYTSSQMVPFLIIGHIINYTHVHMYLCYNVHTGLSSGAIVGISVSGIIVLVLVVMLTSVCIGLLVYGYKNPNSKIGLYMIEVRIMPMCWSV